MLSKRIIISFPTLVIISIFTNATAEGQSQGFQSRYQCNADEAAAYPHYCYLMALVASNPKHISRALFNWAKGVGFVVDDYNYSSEQTPLSPNPIAGIQRNLRSTSSHLGARRGSSSDTPTVLAHGMGDSCFNGGMQSVTKRVSGLTGQYATCVPTGDNLHDDTINGYFLSMDANIEIFAEKIRNDPALENGFDAIGFSQGNNVIRGYIAKYNDPPVNTFISINGVNAGIGAVPYCIPKGDFHKLEYDYAKKNEGIEEKALHLNLDLEGRICDALMEVASHRAYSDFSQRHSFQANYWRDPRPEEKENYQKYSQLAKLNNEAAVPDATLNQNYAKTKKFVWVMATKDSIVWPREGEQWGQPNSEADDPFDESTVLTMEETDWYKLDLFGLKSADDEGRNFFEAFDGDHLAFRWPQFDAWIAKYLLA